VAPVRSSSKGLNVLTPLALLALAATLGCGRLKAPSADSGSDAGTAGSGPDAPAADGSVDEEQSPDAPATDGPDAPATDGPDAPSTDGTDGPAGETQPPDELVAEACAAVAKAWCDERASCFGKVIKPSIDIVRLFGTTGECLARQQLLCVKTFRAPGSGHSLATEAQCAQDLASYSCADFYANDEPASCQPPGARVAGAACAFDAQCASGFCTGEREATCGTCAPEPVAGAPCTGILDCGRGQICDQMSMTCMPPFASDEGCMLTVSGDSCAYGLTCDVPPAHMHLGQCVAAGEPGASCNALDSSGCDLVQGVLCGAYTCFAMTFVGDGAPCGWLSFGATAGCTAGECYTATGLAGVSHTGTCKANAADGAPCDTVTGPGCEFPGVCVPGAGTSGVCRVPDGVCN
jgi:hypothetical protein